MIFNLNDVRFDGVATFVKYVIYISIIALAIAGLFHYEGSLYIYLIFSIVSNVLLYFGFRKNAIFFDTFIGIFFWLGFWLKLSVRICFSDGRFREAVGNFDGSAAAFDQALLVTSCGLMGLLAASFVREKFIFRYPEKLKKCSRDSVLNFYSEYRKLILVGFVVLFISVALTNALFGIYQRGEITKTELPWGLNGVYKWLLLFGLASVSAMILRYEILAKNRVTYPVVIISLLESFATNVSLLSRGMILNVSALVYGIYSILKVDSIKVNYRFVVATFLMFTIIFASSVFVVNYIRSPDTKKLGQSQNQSLKISEASSMAKPLLLDRWVGIEGVMAVSSSPRLGWELWQSAWKEKYSENTISFYDQNLIVSPYLDDDFTVVHFISLPGILAFCFYPGSFAFLFGCMFLLGLFAVFIEMSAYKLAGNNLILCSLIAEVVAFRFASFGYVPAQSYLLFGSIFLNLIIIYTLYKSINYWDARRSNKIAVSQ
ncbi:MAG: hypothetical protein WC236_02215 [Gallionellaceae bacterium]|jgi:hypothetical protein